MMFAGRHLVVGEYNESAGVFVSPGGECNVYFKEDAETDSLDAAIDELGSEYSEEEIRLVRIKFISEVAN